MPFDLQELRRQPGRRPAAGVQAVELAGLRLVDDGEQVAADAVVIGSTRPITALVGDRRVDGVAAALENLHAGLRRQRLTRRDDAVLGRDLGSAGDDARLDGRGFLTVHADEADDDAREDGDTKSHDTLHQATGLAR